MKNAIPVHIKKQPSERAKDFVCSSPSYKRHEGG